MCIRDRSTLLKGLKTICLFRKKYVSPKLRISNYDLPPWISGKLYHKSSLNFRKLSITLDWSPSQSTFFLSNFWIIHWIATNFLLNSFTWLHISFWSSLKDFKIIQRFSITWWYFRISEITLENTNINGIRSIIRVYDKFC